MSGPGVLRPDADTHAEQREPHAPTDQRFFKGRRGDRLQRGKPGGSVRLGGAGAGGPRVHGAEHFVQYTFPMSHCWLYFIAVAHGLVCGQERQFEVVSVKYAGSYDSLQTASLRGGPGTSDPVHIVWERVLMLQLLNRAYGGDFDQISGPNWIDSQEYTIRANLPPGATKDDLPKMWQRMLEERFPLAVHHRKEEFPVYELLVAKDGPRIQKSAAGAGQAVAGGSRPTRGGDGFPVLPPGVHHAMFQATENGVRITRETFRDCSMAQLVQELAWPLGAPSAWQHVLSVGRVVDKTGLSGSYDFKLYYAGAHYPGGAFPQPGQDAEFGAAPTLFDAIQQQLGLKLQETKALLDVLVVDHLERMPTDN
jgi:uncharacterized protein (TIGR03435 family)